jgi:hypothetical protein
MVKEFKFLEQQLQDFLKLVNLKRKELNVFLNKEILQNHYKKDLIIAQNIKSY